MSFVKDDVQSLNSIKMKKLIYLFLSIILVGATFMISCSKSSSTPANVLSIRFNTASGYISADKSVPAFSPLLFGIIATPGDGKLNRFFVQRTANGKTSTVIDSSFSASSFNYDLHSYASGMIGTEVWVFTIFDNTGGSAIIKLTITTTATLSNRPTYNYSTKVHGAQTSKIGSHFVSFNGTVFSLAVAKINSSTKNQQPC